MISLKKRKRIARDYYNSIVLKPIIEQYTIYKDSIRIGRISLLQSNIKHRFVFFDIYLIDKNPETYYYLRDILDELYKICKEKKYDQVIIALNDKNDLGDRLVDYHEFNCDADYLYGTLYYKKLA